MASGRRAWTAARASASRAAGVTAASVAVLIREAGSGRMIVSGLRGAADAGGGVGEDQAVLLAVPRQGPQRDEDLVALVAAQRGDRRGDVAGGDLAQVIVAAGPLFQERVDAAEVDADGVGLAGQGPGGAVPQGACPAAGAGGDARRQRGELALGPRVQGKDAVVVEQPGEERISAVRETLRSRGRSAGSRADQGIFSPGTWLASMTARARAVSAWTRGFQPRASPSREAMARACSRAGLLTDAAVQCRAWNAQGLARGRQFRLLPAGIRAARRGRGPRPAGAAGAGGSSWPRRRTTAGAT